MAALRANVLFSSFSLKSGIGHKSPVRKACLCVELVRSPYHSDALGVLCRYLPARRETSFWCLAGEHKNKKALRIENRLSLVIWMKRVLKPEDKSTTL